MTILLILYKIGIVQTDLRRFDEPGADDWTSNRKQEIRFDLGLHDWASFGHLVGLRIL